MNGRGLKGVWRAGAGRAAGVILGAAALLGAGFAGWTLWRVARSPGGGTAAIGEGTGGTPAPPGSNTGMADTATVEAVLASVQQLVKAENFTAAERVLSDAVRQFPEDQDLRLSYGTFLMSKERWAEAYDQFAGAIEVGPVPATVQYTAGTLASMTDRSALAAAHYAAAMRADPNTPEYPIYLASVQMDMNQLSEAKASLAMAARVAPDRAMIWGMLAQIALRENKTGMAAQHIERARAIEPAEPGWVLMEARIRKRTGEPGRALDLLSALPQSDLDQPETLALLAECYGVLGRPAEAASRYVDAAERSPDNPDLAFEAALWLERAGERDGAVTWANRAAELGHPRAPGWIESLAGVDTAEDQP